MRVVLIGVVVAALVACSSGSGSGAKTTSSSRSSVSVGGVAPSGGAEAWPAPPADQVAELTAAAGLTLQTHETLDYHVHAHLDVFIDGQHRSVAAGIGIVITDPAVHTFDIGGQPAYGGITVPCNQPCISPLHTHDRTGILHTESSATTDNTLGQFFVEWNVRLDGNCVGDYCTPTKPIAVYVDGNTTPLAQAAQIPLTNFKEIAIVIGTPPSSIPKSADFSQA